MAHFATKLAPTPEPSVRIDTKPVASRFDARNYACAVEAIRTGCGRVIERTCVVTKTTVKGNPPRGVPDKVIEAFAADQTYRLWEPVIEGASYGTTRTSAKGAVWGLASTRLPAEPLTDKKAREAWEATQEARAVRVIRENCVELRGEGLDDLGGRLDSGIMATCGLVRLMGTARIRAERVEQESLRARREAAGVAFASKSEIADGDKRRKENKRRTVAAAAALGWPVADDNEADAIFVGAVVARRGV